MAITDINISEQLETDAPSIKYTGNEGPQASPQHQQEQMIAKQIWDALGPEQQGQFQSFEQFFQSGVWKQILQQMQADEGQAQGPQPGQAQGIAGLGPRNMEQQMPMPNRMGAQYGGRMGYSDGGNYEAQVQQLMDQGIHRPMAEFLASQGISTELKAQGGRMGNQSGEMVEKIKEKIREGGDLAMGIPGVDESIWIEKLIEHLRKKRGERRPDPREELRPLPSPGRPDNYRPLPSPGRPGPGNYRPYEEEEIVGIESLRGNI